MYSRATWESYALVGDNSPSNVLSGCADSVCAFSIPIEVNGLPLKASVHSGAQQTISERNLNIL